MSPSGVTHYDEELKYLARLLRALPEAIPLGDCHDFIGYIPGPKKIAVAGCTQTVVSHALAASFNRSTGSVAPIIFQSRGTELEEVTTVLRRYITGNAGSNGLLVSWVDDLTTAATSAITTAGIPLPRKVNITTAKRLSRLKFSVLANSMPEERTVTNFTRIDTKGRASQDARTIVNMTKIYQRNRRVARAAGTLPKRASKAPELNWRSVKSLFAPPTPPPTLTSVLVAGAGTEGEEPRVSFTPEC
ncbi:hypothetical protein C8J57DRAFT_1728953 [Mycena rebaudengoi]|nr:hypothetical protein C8J57DRAFT_1728953 [Mycena rebaudengoi]